jgi:hypothetical protein
MSPLTLSLDFFDNFAAPEQGQVRLRPTCAGLLQQPRIPWRLWVSTLATSLNLRTEHRLDAYATLTLSRGCCWFVDFSVGDLEASLHTPEG